MKKKRMYEGRHLDESQIILDDNHEIIVVCCYFDTLFISSSTAHSVSGVELLPHGVRVP